MCLFRRVPEGNTHISQIIYYVSVVMGVIVVCIYAYVSLL